LRVKPSQEEHLHNGLASLKPRLNAESQSQQGRALKGILKHAPKRDEIAKSSREVLMSTLIATVRANDHVHRHMSQRSEFAQAVGAYFLRGIQNGVLLKAEQEVEAGSLREEISLLLRAFEQEQTPEGYTKETSSVEHSRMKNAETFRLLGNAFINLGMTLPAGTRDDPLRNDSVALTLGNTIMQSDQAGTRSDAPYIEENMRKEVATALGRAILHIRNAAGIQANSILRPNSDTYEKDRAFKTSVGRLTLQLLEGAGTRSVSSLDPKRKEVFMETLGGVMLKLEAMASRGVQQERNREDKTELHRLPSVSGPSAIKQHPEQKPAVKTERPDIKRVGSIIQKESTQRESQLVRATNTGDHLTKRPILPTRYVQG
jgi:hypothetical protein